MHKNQAPGASHEGLLAWMLGIGGAAGMNALVWELSGPEVLVACLTDLQGSVEGAMSCMPHRPKLPGSPAQHTRQLLCFLLNFEFGHQLASLAAWLAAVLCRTLDDSRDSRHSRLA